MMLVPTGMRSGGQVIYFDDSAPFQDTRQILEDGHVGADNMLSYHWYARECQFTPGFEVLMQSKPWPDGMGLHVCIQKEYSVHVKRMYTINVLVKLQTNNSVSISSRNFGTTQRHTVANVATLAQAYQRKRLDADD